jgi:hypothetical protein
MKLKLRLRWRWRLWRAKHWEWRAWVEWNQGVGGFGQLDRARHHVEQVRLER